MYTNLPEISETDRMRIPGLVLERGINCTGIESWELPSIVPTLRELVYFFEMNETFGKDIAAEPYFSEWVSTFKEPRKPKAGELVPDGYRPIRLINLPIRVFNYQDSWQADYYSKNAHDVLEPPSGWILRCDFETGYPEITGTKKESMKLFGKDASQFSAEDGFRPIRRVYKTFLLWSVVEGKTRFRLSPANYGPIGIDATKHPTYNDQKTGFRRVERECL